MTCKNFKCIENFLSFAVTNIRKLNFYVVPASPLDLLIPQIPRIYRILGWPHPKILGIHLIDLYLERSVV